jgi:hypothetical protein
MVYSIMIHELKQRHEARMKALVVHYTVSCKGKWPDKREKTNLHLKLRITSPKYAIFYFSRYEIL